MNLLKCLRVTFFAVCFVLAVFICKAEEGATPRLTTLSSTVISGYVDVSAAFSNTNASAHGLAGTWVGIMTERSMTNRTELYVAIDENGNFAARAMNFDRTIGSGQLDGTLNDSGKATIGPTRFHFLRKGVGTVIGRGENGRLFTARLLREQIR